MTLLDGVAVGRGVIQLIETNSQKDQLFFRPVRMDRNKRIYSTKWAGAT